MKIEVLMATMFESNIVEKCKQANFQTDALIINQCNEDKYEEILFDGHRIRMISTKERGLSNSRNMALKYAEGDICILADDDESFYDKYSTKIKRAFLRIEGAEVLVFNVDRVNAKGDNIEKKFNHIKKIHKFKTYSSVHIVFKREFVLNNKIKFDNRFGTGSGKYHMAEDAIFFRDCHKKNVHAYTVPNTIAKVMQIDSTWFKGYNKQYFYDVGAFLSKSYPRIKHFVKWYYPVRMLKEDSISLKQIMYFINAGIKGYKYNKSYEDYFKRK